MNGTDDSAFPNRVISHVNNHHIIHYVVKKCSFPLAPREFYLRSMWKKVEGTEDYIICTKSLNAEERDALVDCERATQEKVIEVSFSGFFYLQRLELDCSKLTYITKCDLKVSKT